MDLTGSVLSGRRLVIESLITIPAARRPPGPGPLPRLLSVPGSDGWTLRAEFADRPVALFQGTAHDGLHEWIRALLEPGLPETAPALEDLAQWAAASTDGYLVPIAGGHTEAMVEALRPGFEDRDAFLQVLGIARDLRPPRLLGPLRSAFHRRSGSSAESDYHTAAALLCYGDARGLETVLVMAESSGVDWPEDAARAINAFFGEERLLPRSPEVWMGLEKDPRPAQVARLRAEFVSPARGPLR